MDQTRMIRGRVILGGTRQLALAIAIALAVAIPVQAQAAGATADGSTAAAPPAAKDAKAGDEPAKAKPKPAPRANQPIQTLTGMTVNGFAASLSRAQEIKRFAPTVVDAISAEDALTLPYASVTEALQRVPGVAVSAFGVAADPDHFSIQGTDISLEGLPYINTLFNGRDVFSAGGGEGLNFFTVSPELIGAVVVKKNQTADALEGGIAGSIDLHTRKPFDSDKTTQAAFTVGGYWGNRARHGTPQLAGLLSHIFDTSIGRFGILENIAYDRIDQLDNALSVVDFQRRCNGCILPGERPDSFPGLGPGQYAYVPLGGDIRDQSETSNRLGNVLVGQWESPDKAWKATVEWDRVADTETTFEHTLQSSTDGCAFSAMITCGIPLAGTTPVYYPNGVMQSGIVTALPIPSSFQPLNDGGLQTQLVTAAFRNRYVTNDYSAHLDWHVNDRLQLSLDAQDTQANYTYLYYYIRQLTTANWQIALNGRDGVPTLAILSPDPAQTSAQFFANPNNVFWNSAQDSHRDSWGNQHAYRFDGTFNIDAGFLDDLHFGVRRAAQSEVVQNANFNYVTVSAPFGQNAVTAAQTPGDYAYFNLTTPAFGNGFSFTGPYFNLNPMEQFAQAVAVMRAINAQFIAQNPGNGGGPYFTDYDRPQNVPGSGGFEPQEISSNRETTSAGYVRLDFGNSGTDFLGGLQINGNVGVRLVHTRDAATGFLLLPNQPLAMNGLSIEQFCKNETNGGGAAQPGTFCALNPQQQAQYVQFANGAYTPISAADAYNNVLPSFNVSVGWTHDLVTRFAFSQSIYRPTIVQLQAGQSVNGLLPYGTNGSTVPTVSGGGGQVNPYLRPITAHNFDLSQEWYFGKVGSLTGMLFYKKLNNTIQTITSVVNTTATNNGVTYPEQYMAGLQNLQKSGSVQGAELAYQQTYSFLPGWLSGLGTMMNFTYIKAHGLAFGEKEFCPATYAAATQCIDQLTLPPIELSRDNANFIVYFEHGPVAARLGWNWRSAYLITGFEADYPFVPVMAAPQGQLDGSFSYALTRHLKLSLQVANILNSTFKTREIINTSGLQVPKGFFRNDTRANLSLRGSF